MTLNDRKKITKEKSMKTCGHPSEVVRNVANLASEDFTCATGNKIVIDGRTGMQNCLSLEIKRKKTWKN